MMVVAPVAEILCRSTALRVLFGQPHHSGFPAGGLEGFRPSRRPPFFHDPHCWPDGQTAEDQKRSSVMFLPKPKGRLARRAFPAELRNPQVMYTYCIIAYSLPWLCRIVSCRGCSC